jgi:BCCT family betaine/carnitine transporter
MNDTRQTRSYWVWTVADLIDTDYEIGQDNIEGSVARVSADIPDRCSVFSGHRSVAFVFFYTLTCPSGSGFHWLFSTVTKGFDWFFVTRAASLCSFCLFLIVSP